MAEILPSRVNKIIERRGEDTYVDKISILESSPDPFWGTERLDRDDVTTTSTHKILWQRNIVGEKQRPVGEDNLGISVCFAKAANPVDNDDGYEYRLRRIYASGNYQVIEMKPHRIDASGLNIYKEIWCRRVP